MCWVYTGEKRARIGGVIVPDANLCKLPKYVLDNLVKNKTIKKRKNVTKQNGTDSGKSTKRTKATDTDCGCEKPKRPEIQGGSI